MPAHLREPSGQVARGQAWAATALPPASVTERAFAEGTEPRTKGMPHVVPPLDSEGAWPSIHLMRVLSVM